MGVRSLKLVHLFILASINLVERFTFTVHPFRPAVLTAPENKYRSGARRRKVKILSKLHKSVSITKNLPPHRSNTCILQHGLREVNLRASKHCEAPGALIVTTYTAYPISLGMENDRSAHGTLVDPIQVVPQHRHSK